MANALAVRSASLVASGFLIGAAVLAALTVSYTVQLSLFRDAPTAIMIPETPPEPRPAPNRVRRPQAPDPLAETRIIEVEAAPPTQVEAGGFGGIGAGAGPVTITDPAWVRRPDGLDRYYPQRARARGVEGAVLLDCQVTPTGALICVVLSETPARWGFAAAALRMSRDHQMLPAMRDGAPVGGRYRMRVPFELD